MHWSSYFRVLNAAVVIDVAEPEYAAVRSFSSDDFPLPFSPVMQTMACRSISRCIAAAIIRKRAIRTPLLGKRSESQRYSESSSLLAPDRIAVIATNNDSSVYNEPLTTRKGFGGIQIM